MAQFRIMLVDDQHEVRRVLRAGLESLGRQYSVVDTPSAEEALLIITRHPIDLLVADVRLPGMSGLELMQRVQKRVPGVKVFLVTGLTDNKIRRQVADAGANAFFIKPIEMADFLDAVERTLGVVQTFLPEEPILEAESPLPTLSDQLANLRKDLQATSAVLLDDQGRVMAEAGEMPDGSNDYSLLPYIMACLSAGSKVTNALGMKLPENIFYFKGQKYNLTLAPVGRAAALLIVHPTTAEIPGKTGVLIWPVVQDLVKILEKMEAGPVTPVAVDMEATEIAPLPTAEVGEVAREPALIDLIPGYEVTPEELSQVEELLVHLDLDKLPVDDVDGFWNAALEQTDPNDVGNARAISYDQARKLGLAPEEQKTNP